MSPPDRQLEEGRSVRASRYRRLGVGSQCVSPRELRTTQGKWRWGRPCPNRVEVSRSGLGDDATPRSRVARPEEGARCQGTTQVVRVTSRSVLGATDREQSGALVVEQAQCAAAREVPAAPVI